MNTRSPVRGLTSLREVPAGTLIFIDSNIFTYFLLGGSQHFETCKDFPKRVENGDIQGLINEIVVAETWYNYLKYRILKENGLALKDFHAFVKKKPSVISKNRPIRACGNIFHSKSASCFSATFVSCGCSRWRGIPASLVQ